MVRKAKRDRQYNGARARTEKTKAWMRAHKWVVGVLASITAVTGILVSLHSLQWWPFNPPTAQELASQYDNTNPSLECAGNGRDVTTLNSQIINSRVDGTQLAVVEVRHSSCKTSWLRVVTSMKYGTVVKMITREAADGVPAATVATEDPPGSGDGPTYESWSNQIYSSGCVEASAEIFDASGQLIGELTPSKFC